MHQDTNAQYAVILFDGVCNLCSGSVQFVIRHDPMQRFRFASLQSAFGQEILKKFNVAMGDFRSFILLEDGKLYTKSSAALRVCKKLNSGWKLLYTFVILPRFIRDAVYSFVAANRYRWFGRKESCWLPEPRLRHLFLDQGAAL